MLEYTKNLPRGAYGPDGGKRLESRCALCRRRVWWCLRPMPGDLPYPYNCDGKKHVETCKFAGRYSDVKEFLLACAGAPVDKQRLARKME